MAKRGPKPKKVSSDLPELLDAIEEWRKAPTGLKPRVSFSIAGKPFVLTKKYEDGSIKLTPEDKC